MFILLSNKEYRKTANSLILCSSSSFTPLIKKNCFSKQKLISSQKHPNENLKMVTKAEQPYPTKAETQKI